VAQERIIIYFKQPQTEVFIDQEVVTQELEAKLSLLLVELRLDREDSVDYNISHLGKKMIFDAYSQVWELIIKKVLKLFERNSVTFFM
jgi:hypothetical protein